jgi:hypothetical protein
MPTATVKGRTGEGFEARVTELRPNSILLQTDHALDFREPVTIELLGTMLRGEVVFAADQTAAVTFPMSPEIFDLIEAYESELDAPSDDDAPPPPRAAGPSSQPLPDVFASIRDGRLSTRDDVDTLGLLLALVSGRPIVVRADAPPQEVSLIGSGGTIDLVATPVANGLFTLEPIDPSQLELTIASMRRCLDRFEPEPQGYPMSETTLPPVVPPPMPGAPPAPEPDADPNDVPSLEPDGRTILFKSHAQYVAQHRVNLRNGAIVLAMAPLPPGTRKELAIVVPGAKGPVSFGAQVMFQGPGTLGFSIALNDLLKTKLDDLVTRPESVGSVPTPPARASSIRPSLALTHEATIALPSIGELLRFSARPPEIALCHGYIQILDFLFARQGEAVLKIAGDEEITLWIYRGKVVFSERRPERPDDLLGRRLLQARAVHRSSVDAALSDVSRERPLGVILVDGGKAPQDVVSRELKAQITDRVLVPIRFDRAPLAVSPWREPPVQAKLVAVAGEGLVVELLRLDLRQRTQEDMMKALREQLDHRLEVDLEKIATTFRLADKEMRFFQRIAQSPAILASAGTSGGVSQTEGLRNAVLACALGFGTLVRVEHEKQAAQAKLDTEDLLVQQLHAIAGVDHFQVLGIHWTATAKEIRAAYEAERKKLHMRKSQATDKTKDVITKLSGRLDAALAALNNVKERKGLRESMANAMERQHAAEHLVQQAEIAIFREAYDEATDLLDTADELTLTRRAKQLRAQLNRV